MGNELHYGTLLRWSFLLAGITGIWLAQPQAWAQNVIIPDDTLGIGEGSEIENVDANTSVIRGGATRGQNLFHSFEEFNVDEGFEALFFSPTGSENIFGRVTGSNPSNILGVLGTTGEATPNLYFINPNGVVFGPGSSLAVEGSFTATTANAVQFGELGLFSATDPEVPSQLLTISPSAFFFSQINPTAKIENFSRADAGRDPSDSFDRFGLRVPDGQSLTFVGGDITINGGGIVAFGGRVELGGLSAEGVVDLNPDASLSFPEGLDRSDVTLDNNAGIIVAGSSGGDVAINANNINILEGSSIQAGIGENLGSINSQAGDITLNATGNIRIQNGFEDISQVSNFVNETSTGNGGNITVNAQSLYLRGEAFIATATFGEGNSGNVSIISNDIIAEGLDPLTFDGSPIIAAIVGEGGVGNGGNTYLEVGSLSLKNGAQINISTSGQGNAGTLLINARENVSITTSTIFSEVSEDGIMGEGGNVTIYAQNLILRDAGTIRADTENEGNAGDISINVIDTVLMGGIAVNNTSGGDVVSSRIFATVEPSGVGTGGDISITTGSLIMDFGSDISTFTQGQGDGGNITINATEIISLEGSDSLNSDDNPRLNASVRGGADGNGGNIHLMTRLLSLSDGAQINISTSGVGDAGNLVINAQEDISVERSSIFSEVSDRGGQGRGGNVIVDTQNLFIRDGGSIRADTENIGDAGNVSIKASGTVLLSGAAETNTSLGDIIPSQIFATVEERGLGEGGDINISSSNFVMENGSEINTSTTGRGDSGNIFIEAITFSMEGDARIDTSTFGLGRAGNITIDVDDSLKISGTNAGLFSTTEDPWLGFEQPEDAGESLSLAQDLTTDKDISTTYTLAGNLGDDNDVDLYKISIEPGSSFSATTGLDSSTDTRLFLFDAEGRGIYFNDDINRNILQSTLPSNHPLTPNSPGTYYLAVTSYENAPLSEAGNIFGFGGFTDIIGPTGDGGGLPLESWTNEGTDAGSYMVQLTGVSGPLPPGQDGGNITIHSGTLSLENGAQISVETLGQGNAGDIQISVVDSMLLSNSTISSAVGENSSGEGGDISIQSGNLFLNEDSVISAESISMLTEGNNTLLQIQNLAADQVTPDAGNILINVDDVLFMENSDITTQAVASAGGTIAIRAGNIRLFGDSDIRTNVQSGGAGGGNIDLTADFIAAFDDSDILAFSAGGQGGDIILRTGGFFGEGFTPSSLTADPANLEGNNRVDINATGAISGEVFLPNINFIENSLNELPEAITPPEQLLAGSCIAWVDVDQGSFVVTGNGGLPTRPGDTMLSTYPTIEVQPVTETQALWQPGDPIVEPTGAFPLADGRLVLSRECD